jgi:hypothetical protein
VIAGEQAAAPHAGFVDPGGDLIATVGSLRASSPRPAPR